MHPHSHSRRRQVSGALFAATTLVFAGAASALESGPIPPPSMPPIDQNVPAPRHVDGLGEVVEANGLARLRGGTEIENEVDINGVVGGNHAENITTGDNTLAGGAFGNATGINTVIQNSGSNVLIQNGMVVNVQFTPTP